MIEGELGVRIVEALSAYPQPVSARPSSAVVGAAAVVTEQEGLDAVLHPSTVVLEVFTEANKIEQRFFLGLRHTDGGELAGAMQPSEVPRIEAIGLHALAGSLRDEARCDHVARDVQ